MFHHYPSAAGQQQQQRKQQQQQQQKQLGCGFCKKNRESASEYSNHQLKNERGEVVCPQLSKHVCEMCGATGIEAHTRSYCPQVIDLRRQREMANSRKNSATSSVATKEEDDEEENEEDFTIKFGQPFRPMTNMGLVSHSRYNSAGRLRNPRRSDFAHRNNSNNQYRRQQQQQHQQPPLHRDQEQQQQQQQQEQRHHNFQYRDQLSNWR